MTGGSTLRLAGGASIFFLFFFFKQKSPFDSSALPFLKNQQISPRFCNYSDLLLLNDVINHKELQL